MSENPINRVPPEIWEKIAENVVSSKDLVNLSTAIPAFKSAVYPKRVEWLFYQVVPVLVTNLYSNSYDRFQTDFLNCRLVCKHWRFSIDNFLENNVLHYPASGDNVDWKLNRCQNGQSFYLSRTETIFRHTKVTTMQKMLNEAVNYPGNPIIGRFVNLSVPEEENPEGVNLVERFVETFGHHIYFLKVHFSGKCNPIRFILILLRLLQNLPHLKGLAISKDTGFSILNKKEYSLMELKRELNQILPTSISSEAFRNSLPKLETLNLEIVELNGNILNQIIVGMFCPTSLKSLTAVKFVCDDGTILDFPNLLHLSLHIMNTEELESVLNLNCPNLRKLDFSKLMYHDLDYDLLHQVIHKFKSTLNHLSLKLPDVLEPVHEEDKIKMIQFFKTAGNLKLPNIKSLSLFGCCALSFNFVCGDFFESLEYLNLFLEEEIDNDETATNLPLPEETHPEITDVLKLLTPVWTRGCWWEKPDMKRSNVWNIFPKLKSILIDSYWEPLNLHRWTYKRTDL